MASVDSLSIQITASATSATTRINELCASLDKLVGAINQLDVSKFVTLAEVTDSLSQSLASLKGTGVKQVQKLAKASAEVPTSGLPRVPPRGATRRQASR